MAEQVVDPRVAVHERRRMGKGEGAPCVGEARDAFGEPGLVIAVKDSGMVPDGCADARQWIIQRPEREWRGRAVVQVAQQPTEIGCGGEGRSSWNVAPEGDGRAVHAQG